jgi:hypothetical protein
LTVISIFSLAGSSAAVAAAAMLSTNDCGSPNALDGFNDEIVSATQTELSEFEFENMQCLRFHSLIGNGARMPDDLRQDLDELLKLDHDEYSLTFLRNGPPKAVAESKVRNVLDTVERKRFRSVTSIETEHPNSALVVDADPLWPPPTKPRTETPFDECQMDSMGSEYLHECPHGDQGRRVTPLK